MFVSFRGTFVPVGLAWIYLNLLKLKITYAHFNKFKE